MNRVNRLCVGWLASITIMVALRVRWVMYVTCKEGSGAPMIFQAVFTIHCRALLL